MNPQISNLIFIAAIIGIFYFLLIRPQQKRAQQQKSMLASLKPGDEIVTVGGIFGSIVDVGDRIRIRVADGTEFEIAKQAIGQVLPASGATDSSAEGPDEAESDDASEGVTLP